MRVFVLGAGVSHRVGYPLGARLFQEIDKYVKNAGPLWKRFDYAKDWPRLCRRLSESRNTLIREAYYRRQLEHLFTILDLASLTHTEALLGVFYSSKMSKRAIAQADSHYRKVDQVTKSYLRYRQILLWALEGYFQDKHHYDREQFNESKWAALKAFGERLSSGDVVLTFNYDSTLQRVLLEQGKWSPCNGYGFEIHFQESNRNNTPKTFPESPIVTLHLHGSIGWYKRPVLKEGFLKEDGGAVPAEALGHAPLSTRVSLDPIFLRDLGIDAVDESLPRRPPHDPQILLHPSFFKNYEMEGESNVFLELWRKAAEALRLAKKIVIIGYSLPSADSAALTLLLTNCDRSKVEIVNSDPTANRRLRRLLSTNWLAGPKSFENWLNKTAGT